MYVTKACRCRMIWRWCVIFLNLGAYLANRHEIVIGFTISDPKIRRTLTEFLQDSQSLQFSDQHSRLLHESGGLLRLRVHFDFRPQNFVSAEKILHERLHHNRRIRRHHHLPLAFIEHLETLRPHIRRVEPSDYRADATNTEQKNSTN